MGCNWTMHASVGLLMIIVASSHPPSSSVFSTSDGDRLLATTKLLRQQKSWHLNAHQYNLTSRSAATSSDTSAYKIQKYSCNKYYLFPESSLDIIHMCRKPKLNIFLQIIQHTFILPLLVTFLVFLYHQIFLGKFISLLLLKLPQRN